MDADRLREMAEAEGLDPDMLKAVEAEKRWEQVRAFVEESNRIERIYRDPTTEEVRAHLDFLQLDRPTVWELEKLVAVCEPEREDKPAARLRRKEGENIRVVDMKTGQTMFQPPNGGPRIEANLVDLLDSIVAGRLVPAEAHAAYETLHPFTDGNGRSGRALWAWHMEKLGENPFGLDFLHRWYYQSLDLVRRMRPVESPAD